MNGQICIDPYWNMSFLSTRDKGQIDKYYDIRRIL